jgi:ATP-dependent helicase HrpA
MFTTDSSFTRKAQETPLLNDVNVLIIDEAHERSLHTDVVLGIAHLLLQQRDDFFVVIASATIDPKPFLKFFGLTSVPLKVEGRLYPIALEYRPFDNNKAKDDKSKGKGQGQGDIGEGEEVHAMRVMSKNDFVVDHVIPETSSALKRYDVGHVLVFLPGQMEINKAVQAMEKRKIPKLIVLSLFGGMSEEDQDDVMRFEEKHPGGNRMVVFCTNVAETSITVPGVKIVIDSGLAKESRFDNKRKLQVVEEIFISRSSANQRKGRAGRVSSGTCIRLYAESDLQRDNIEPEILRSSLDRVALELLCLGKDPEQFPFIAREEDTSTDGSFGTDLKAAIALLHTLQCCKQQPQVVVVGEGDEGGEGSSGEYVKTPVGQLFNELPFDPRICAFIMTAYCEFDCLDDVVIVAALLMASGPIFFTGGKTTDANKKAQARQQGEYIPILYLSSTSIWTLTYLLVSITPYSRRGSHAP